MLELHYPMIQFLIIMNITRLLMGKDLVHHFVRGIRNTAQGILNPTND